MQTIGRHIWAIAEGYLPKDDPQKSRELISHEAACILNVGDEVAKVEITIFFHNREPIGPYHIEVPPRRTTHVRFNDLKDPEPIPTATEYSSLFVSTAPVVIQHTRLDDRSGSIAIMSTIAYPAA